jgi:heptosyltransferase-2
VKTYRSILVIQTAFTGDAVLGSSVLETLHQANPDARITYLVRAGHASLFTHHPFIHAVPEWKKTTGKTKALADLLINIRRQRFDLVVNLQRYFSTGLLTAFSGARETRGFAKNPLSFLFSRKYPHSMNRGFHEIERNHALIKDFAPELKLPKIYLSEAEMAKVKPFEGSLVLAPASVWSTKQWPATHWSELIRLAADKYSIVLIGGKNDQKLCEEIARNSGKQVHNLSGKLSFLESAALMKKAALTVSNDSAPVHLASSVDAAVLELFCSTVPDFGFTPLSSNSQYLETSEKLSCRPCGLHGKKSCPLQHFSCGNTLTPESVLKKINEMVGQ